MYYSNTGAFLSNDKIQPTIEKCEFEVIDQTWSVYDIKNIDPSTLAYFLYTGDTEAPKKSRNYTTDSYLIEIEYNSNCFVSKINCELI